MFRSFAVFLSLAATAAGAAEQGQLDASATLFSVMAAVTAAAPEAPADPLRAAVYSHVNGRKPGVLPELKRFFYDHRKADPAANLAQYISFALVSEEPPTFKPTLSGTEVPPDVQPLQGFRELMVRFHNEADIDDLWRKLQPAHEQAIAKYHEPVSRALLEVNGYLRNPTSGYMGRRFQVFVDLLAPSNQVHTRSYREEYFIVVTPSAEPRIDDIRHAYLHYLLDPVATKYNERVMRLRGLGDYAEAAPALGEAYKADFLLLATESLIKGVEARLNRRPAHAQEAMSEGYVLTQYFFEALPAYEKQEAAMRLYLPDMLDAVDLKKEDKRLQQIRFASAKTVRTAPAPVEQPRAAAPPAEQALDAADKLYGNRELDKAREEYLKLVRQTDDKRVHARAYFGLARVAALRNEAELAEQLFRKTLELTPDPHTHSWTEVFLGRLAEGFGERDKAAEHYKAALGIEGAPPGARQAAEQGLTKLSPR